MTGMGRRNSTAQEAVRDLFASTIRPTTYHAPCLILASAALSGLSIAGPTLRAKKT